MKRRLSWVVALHAAYAGVACSGADGTSSSDGSASVGGSAQSGTASAEGGAGGVAAMGGGGGVSTGGASASGSAQSSVGGTGAAGGAGGAAGGSDGGSGGSGAALGSEITFDIQFEYRFDTAGYLDAKKRLLLDESARAWAVYIMSEFADVPAGTALRARHPERIDQEGMVFELEYDIDDLVLLVGSDDIDGPGSTLGSTSSSFTYSVSDAMLLEELRIRYEERPYQPWVAQTTFEPTENWFFDETPESDDDIPSAQSDFQTTAMHEIGHALGFGSSAAFDALVEDGMFVGPRAMELFGGPVPLAPDLAHFAADTEFEGRTPTMELGSRVGERKRPTALDLAALEDIGYEIRWELVP